jgi:hypothetical protein
MQTRPNFFIASLFQNHTYQRRCFVPKNCWYKKKGQIFREYFAKIPRKCSVSHQTLVFIKTRTLFPKKFLSKNEKYEFENVLLSCFPKYKNKNSNFWNLRMIIIFADFLNQTDWRIFSGNNSRISQPISLCIFHKYSNRHKLVEKIWTRQACFVLFYPWELRTLSFLLW